MEQVCMRVKNKKRHKLIREWKYRILTIDWAIKVIGQFDLYLIRYLFKFCLP